MTAPIRDVPLWLDVYDRLMAAYHAGPAGGVASAADPAEAILAKALEYRALILQCPALDSGWPVESVGVVSAPYSRAAGKGPQRTSLGLHGNPASAKALGG